MDWDAFFRSTPEVIDLHGENRWEVIEELVNHLVFTQKISPEHRDAITKSIRERESAMSTGIGSGVGLPHATTELVSDVTVAIGRSRKGIQFDALDGKPVDIVALFLVPKNDFQSICTPWLNLRSC